jgi:peptidyl-prolyl cis-trans isomerase C
MNIFNFFKGNKMKMGAKHILVDQEFEAKDLLNKINDGEAFENLAKDFSKCGSAAQGGDLGTFGKGMMVKDFEDAVIALDVDKVSEPVKTQFGFHIIKRTV